MLASLRTVARLFVGRFVTAGLAWRLLLATTFLFALTPAVYALPVAEYHKHIQQAMAALDGLAKAHDGEDEIAYSARRIETIRSVRELLPKTETVEWNGASDTVDNSWLSLELGKFASAPKPEQPEILKRTTQRLQALDERITELEKATAAATESKAEHSRKLAEILRRPEYASEVKRTSGLNRLVERLINWLTSWLPKPKPITPGGFGWLSRIAQVLVIALAVAVLIFVAKLFLPRLLRGRRPKKKTKAKARIVLGERLEPDQSALDLLSEAEALARRGELRAAIRRAYIALLVELGEQKIISLAQYKTNRDYLRAVRQIEPIYENVKQLTDSFELHWYGLVQATETDWLAFRAAYAQALATNVSRM